MGLASLKVNKLPSWDEIYFRQEVRVWPEQEHYTSDIRLDTLGLFSLEQWRRKEYLIE